MFTADTLPNSQYQINLNSNQTDDFLTKGLFDTEQQDSAEANIFDEIDVYLSIKGYLDLLEERTEASNERALLEKYRDRNVILLQNVLYGALYADETKSKTIDNLQKDLKIFESDQIIKLIKYSDQMLARAEQEMEEKQRPVNYNSMSRLRLLQLASGNSEFMKDEWNAIWEALGSTDNLDAFAGNLNGSYYSDSKGKVFVFLDEEFVDTSDLSPEEQEYLEIWRHFNGKNSDFITYTTTFKPDFNPKHHFGSFQNPYKPITTK